MVLIFTLLGLILIFDVFEKRGIVLKEDQDIHNLLRY